MIGTRINSSSLYQAYISSITIRIKPIIASSAAHISDVRVLQTSE